MTKNTNLSVLLSFFGLWLTSLLRNESQIIIGFILILSFGIVHGANDLLLIEKIKGTERTIYWKLLVNYTGAVLLAVVLFAFIPWVGMLLFIIISSYHFGEQHWEEKNIFSSKIISTLFNAIYGLFILLLLFQFHNNEVITVLEGITGITLDFINIPLLFRISGLLLLAFFAFSIFTSKKIQKILAPELFYLLVFTILFKVGSLILAFAIYFIFWHSIPSLFDQVKFLFGEVSVSNFKNYVKSAIIYWLVSIIGIIILYFLLKDYKIFDSIFFSFLAAITFPHVFVIERMFHSTNKKTE